MGENDDFGGAILETTEPSAVVDTPTTPEPEPEKPDADEEQRKAIAEHAFKRREAERHAKEAERRLQELEARLLKQDQPVVPDLPDPLKMTEQDFMAQAAQRDEAIRRRVEWDAQQRALTERQQALEAERQKQQQEALAKSADDYRKRSVQLGVKPEELQQAGNLVGRFGLHDDVVKMILDDDQGPLITKYLASNVQELDQLAALPPIQAAVRIVTAVKQKAAALKPKVSNAPAPTTAVRGVGMVPADYWPEGATFE